MDVTPYVSELWRSFFFLSIWFSPDSERLKHQRTEKTKNQKKSLKQTKTNESIKTSCSSHVEPPGERCVKTGFCRESFRWCSISDMKFKLFFLISRSRVLLSESLHSRGYRTSTVQDSGINSTSSSPPGRPTVQVDPFCRYQEVTLGRRPTVGRGGGGAVRYLNQSESETLYWSPGGNCQRYRWSWKKISKSTRERHKEIQKKKMMSSLLWVRF